MNEEVKTLFSYNNLALNKNLGGISQQDSLQEPDAGGNCINWILGHMVVTRDFLLHTLRLKQMCDENITKLYVRGSDPIKSENAEDLQTLLKIYNDSQEKIMKALDEKDLKGDAEKTETVASLGFHEAYHIGQIGILRRVIGKIGVLQ